MGKGLSAVFPQRVDQNTVPAKRSIKSRIQAKLALVRDKCLHGNSTSHKVGRLARKRRSGDRHRS